MLENLLSTGIRNQRLAFAFLIATHAAGAIGLIYEPTRALFQLLTPYNLILTGAIIFHFEKEKSKNYVLFILITAVIGFLIEVLGVSTGVIFGEYLYGETLGIKLLNVPLSIGLNWAILIYISGIVSNQVSNKPFTRVLVGATIMVVLDFLIEPVAIQYDFWNWTNMVVPVRNYLGWFLLSFILHLIFQKLNFEKSNPLAFKLLLIQFAFFSMLNLFP